MDTLALSAGIGPMSYFTFGLKKDKKKTEIGIMYVDQ